MKKLLVVVDMQNDFITGALGSQQAIAVLPFVRREIVKRLEENWEIAYTRDTHAQDYLSTQEGSRLPVEHCIEGTFGWEIVEDLYIDGAKVFDKPVFGSTALADYVQKGDYQEVELIGVCTDICVISNALLIKAYAPETRVLIKAEACAGVTQASHETALNAMRACQIDII